MNIYLLRKYWAKHKKTATALMSSSIFMVIVFVVSLLIYRTIIIRDLQGAFQNGLFDAMIANVDEQTLDDMQNDKNFSLGYIDVVGSCENENEAFTMGTLYDDKYISNIPFESGGMPQNYGEIAIDRGVLNKLCWLGKIGDDISLSMNGKEEIYTVVGIIEDDYGLYREGSALNKASDGLVGEYPLPLIYISNVQALEYETQYNLVMLLDNMSDVHRYEKTKNEQENHVYSAYSFEKYCDMDTYYIVSGLRGNALYQTLDFSSMGNNLRWFCVLAAIAIMTAAMSVFMVLRSIFMERQNHLRVLKKIGVSNKRLGTMLMIECVSFAIVQTIAGTALGILVYFGIFRFEVSVLGKSPYSAFDGNDFIQTYTPNPFLWAVIASFLVIVIAYILVITLSKKNIALRSKSRNSERSFNGLFTILFRQNFITAIQLLALTMICTGTLLGYTYFSNEGKEGDPNISIDVAKSYIPVSFIVSDNVDMEKEKSHEYYYCPPPSIVSVNSFSMISENYDFGIDDSIADQLGNVMAVGDITWTISVCEQGAAIDNTNVIDDETMSFLGLPDELKDKAIAPMCGKIINQPVFERVASEITNGEVDISSLDSGTQVIILSYSENSDYAVGDKIAIGSISTKNGYTASNYHEKETEVAAILSITDISDTLVKSILDTESEIIFLTTQKGAQNLGIAQAAYTEIFSESEVNGVMIPSSSGFQKVSYDELKKEQIIDKMTEYGGMTLLIVLMSALGFFAYFNGIGMKIRLKSYQLSLLRAVGCNKKTIKNRILVNNLKLPVAAAFLTTIIIKCVQITTEKAYRYALSLVQPSADGAISFDSSILNEVDKINYDYFLDNRLWAVPILKPLLIVLSVMCIITFLLTLFALRNFKGNIADTLNKERVRK